MTARAEPPFRADHVGSLLRPRVLLDAREAFAAGRLDTEELRAAEDAAIGHVVRVQDEIGLGAATDGEFRRTSWHMDFIYQLGGLDAPRNRSGCRCATRPGSRRSPPPGWRCATRCAWSTPSSARTSGSWRPVRAAGAAVPVAAVRVLLHRGGEPALSFDEQVAKLRLVVDTAGEIWG